MVFHNEDGNPARANIKQALGSYERPHKGVKASAKLEYHVFRQSAQDWHPLQDDIRNIVIRQRVEDLQLGIESYYMKLYLTQLGWDASDFHFKEDYIIVCKPKAVIYRDGNNQKKMTRETEVHNFSDGTLIRILEKLDHRVKDYVLFKFNPGMEQRIWSEDDKRRSKEFIEVIERRLKIRRIFKNLESFVSGRVRDIDYRLIQRTE
ncbi:hypothetical protein Tco_0117776 [Tanacetum coccineum]